MVGQERTKRVGDFHLLDLVSVLTVLVGVRKAIRPVRIQLLQLFTYGNPVQCSVAGKELH